MLRNGRVTRSALIVLELGARLRAKLDELERVAVNEARHEGATWQEIGDALGITRQSAHDKHANDVEGTNE